MSKWYCAILTAAMLLVGSPQAQAFCGFYVAKADARLFNKASKVVIVRDRDRTVLTMANDYQGDPQEFAIVIPVPTFLEREQIHIGNSATLDHLDAYSAPRLVEYFDPDPCRRQVAMLESRQAAPTSLMDKRTREGGLGVTVEATYTVGEYDISILSAKESTGLETWLRHNGYRLPPGASRVLGSYIKQQMRFFIAKVNLAAQSKLGFAYLRPLQVAFESPKFMLPIRLGTVNADGPQELFVFALTRTGRVETTNYRTVKLPTDLEIPTFVKNDFGNFYRDMFTQQVENDAMRTVFLEYAWDMNWCDPCAAEPLSDAELRGLGVFWLAAGAETTGRRSQIRRPRPRPGKTAARNVFITRLHLRYTAASFPEDLAFQDTGDRSNFQGRYILRHAWRGEASCPGARQYEETLVRRQESEANTLAMLTGWDIDAIRGKIGLRRKRHPEASPEKKRWWKRLWKDSKDQ